MQSAKKFQELSPYNQSKMFVNALGPLKKLSELRDDPFKHFGSQSSKLMPVSPTCGIRLPKIHSKTAGPSPKLLKVAKNFVLSPRNNISVSGEFQKRKYSLVPATPKLNFIKSSRSQSSKIISDSIKIIENSLCEVSFGESQP